MRTARRPTEMSRSPAVHASTLADRLGSVTRIEEFHQLLVEHHVLDTGGRFVHFEVDVSNKCNIRCRMCHFSFPRVFGAKPIYVAPDVFESIARSLLPHAQALIWSLGSEPLMSPSFAQILKIAARYQVPELGFYTNGLLMTDRIVDAVIDSGVTVVVVSVDGATKETFETIRHGANFHVLLRGLAWGDLLHDAWHGRVCSAARAIRCVQRRHGSSSSSDTRTILRP